MPSDGLWRKIRNYVLQFWLKILGMGAACLLKIHSTGPCGWTKKEKETPLHICTDLLRKAELDGRDAAAIFTVKSKSSSWLKNSSGQGRSNVETIFIVLFDCLGLVILSWHLRNQDLHLTVLWHLCEKRCGYIYDRRFGDVRGRLLRQDNASAHTVLSVLRGLAKNEILLVPVTPQHWSVSSTPFPGEGGN